MADYDPASDDMALDEGAEKIQSGESHIVAAPSDRAPSPNTTDKRNIQILVKYVLDKGEAFEQGLRVQKGQPGGQFQFLSEPESELYKYYRCSLEKAQNEKNATTSDATTSDVPAVPSADSQAGKGKALIFFTN
jgi:hypothetical protein